MNKVSALFVFDHRYPRDIQGNYYYSSGFDQNFFQRYYNIFEEFNIFGREKLLNEDEISKLSRIDNKSTICTFSSNKVSLLKVNKVLKAQIEKNDCIVVRMPSIFGIFAILYARKIRKPYIVEIVGCCFDMLIESEKISRKLLAGPAELIYKSVIKNSEYAIYVTEKFLQKKYPIVGKQYVCSNVKINLNGNNVLNKRIEHISNFDRRNKIVIGTCSTFVDYKGQKYVIQALPKILSMGYDLEYQLVGDGDAGYLSEYARELGVSENVKIIGRLSHEDIFKWLDNLDLYVHPSCTEGLSRAIIEAMSRGCTIAAANTGGTPELIDNFCLFRKKDAGDFARKIIQFLNKEQMMEQAEKNYKRAYEYSEKKIELMRKEIYENFMRENGLI